MTRRPGMQARRSVAQPSRAGQMCTTDQPGEQLDVSFGADSPAASCAYRLEGFGGDGAMRIIGGPARGA